MMGKFQSGAAMPPREIGEKMRGCFEKMGPSEPGNQGEPGAGGMIPPAGQAGPGTINPGGQTMPQQAGPGGCKGPEECKSYCESHPDECKNFQPKQGEGMPSQGQPGQMLVPGTQPNVQMPPRENREGMMPPSGEGMMPGTTQPPIEPQPPVNNITPSPPPPPSEIPAPSPSSSFNPGSSLGSLLNIFLFMFR